MKRSTLEEHPTVEVVLRTIHRATFVGQREQGVSIEAADEIANENVRTWVAAFDEGFIDIESVQFVDVVTSVAGPPTIVVNKVVQHEQLELD